MEWRENNYAFIDSQNLNLGTQKLGWRLDFKRLRVYLTEKHSVSKAFIFIGYLPENKKLYKHLEECGYILVFKPVVKLKDGTIKGNVDGDLILRAAVEYSHYDRAVIISGDGDFYCLVKYLRDRNKLKTILIPNKYKFSWLLKAHIFTPFLEYMNTLKSKLRPQVEA